MRIPVLPRVQMCPILRLEVRSLLLWFVVRVSEAAVSGSLLFRYGMIGTLHSKFTIASSRKAEEPRECRLHRGRSEEQRESRRPRDFRGLAAAGKQPYALCSEGGGLWLGEI